MELRLIKENPNLIPNDGKLPARVVAAKNIRLELARAFPGIKFSVKTKTFSGGNDINVSWTDGPTSKQVDGIIQKYSAGSFDGMVDLYSYNHSAWTTAFGDAKYIFASRLYSDKMVQTVLNSLKKEYGASNAPTLEDYKQGRAWNTTPMSNTQGERHWSWESMLNRGLSEYVEGKE